MANPSWYVIEHPFTRPSVSNPYPSSSFALDAADKIHGERLRRVKVADNEVWIGGIIVCSRKKAMAYKFKIKDWQGKYYEQ
jgi:hypothetical protein